jgi:hypothetical protein
VTVCRDRLGTNQKEIEFKPFSFLGLLRATIVDSKGRTVPCVAPLRIVIARSTSHSHVHGRPELTLSDLT